ncbi:MAG: class I SAM-dependent methyltransferase [Candidatus Kapabacteria bacterium]|nr:class I SAM-dependent methyltransferase [Ignavibacteriota bacterium]MCW5885146.1 class I SAM-dependent methyltransferase [Candidatus Kapabacteria bacterium]
MTDKIKDLVFKSDISDNDKYYWGYMYDLGRVTIVPYLTKLGYFKPGDKVIEIGSAEGGVLHALADKGAVECVGTDIAESRLEMGRVISKVAGLDVKYVYNDIIYGKPDESWLDKYDLAILRDVIEHLDDTEIALRNISHVIKRGGHLFVSFPPYNSPYGGHQHTLAGKFPSRLPYIHHLPEKTFQSLIKSGRPQDIEEVIRLINIKLSPEKFEKAAKNAGYEIVKRDFYLLRPVFKMKFGLPTLKLGFLAGSKIVRNFLCMEASYILKKN